HDRQLHGAEAQSFLGDVLGNAVDLEYDTTGLDAGGPEFNRTLALTHTHFGRLLGHRHVRENPDPYAALALRRAGDRAAGRLDLASGDAFGFRRLQGMLAESPVGTALGNAMDAPLVSFAKLLLLRLQHNELTFLA